MSVYVPVRLWVDLLSAVMQNRYVFAFSMPPLLEIAEYASVEVILGMAVKLVC